MDRRSMMIGGIVGAVAGVFAVGFFARGSAAQNVEVIKPSGADLVANKDILLVDIRTPPEWKQTGVVEGAVLVTYSDPASFLAAVKPLMKPGQRLGLICRSGNRTSRAARQIAPLVDFDVLDIGGGMNRVLGEGYKPVAATRAMGCSVC